METERTESQVLEAALNKASIKTRDTWETAIREVMQEVGDNPRREDLIDTPQRLRKALKEMLQGYSVNPGEFLSVTFDSAHDEMVVVTDMPFVSLCEHHMLPFSGMVAVGYIPQDKIVGLSKIPRAVQALAQRLQVQERLTGEIADAMFENLKPTGVGVWIKASHTCMSCRGVKSSGSMVTSAMRGSFKDHAETRAEFLAAVRGI